MNLDTLTRLLQTYGTVESNWPDEMRAPARELLASDDEARRLMERYAPLDVALDRYRVDPHTVRIRAAIMSKIGARNIVDRITAWLLPYPVNLHAMWRPALAATVPLILGIILGSTLSIGTTTETSDSWSDEISLVALSDNDTGSLP